MRTIIDLKINEVGVITKTKHGKIPLLLLEMGFLPNAEVKLIQKSNGLLYLKVDNNYLVIRLESAKLFKIKNKPL